MTIEVVLLHHRNACMLTTSICLITWLPFSRFSSQNNISSKEKKEKKRKIQLDACIRDMNQLAFGYWASWLKWRHSIHGHLIGFYKYGSFCKDLINHYSIFNIQSKELPTFEFLIYIYKYFWVYKYFSIILLSFW